MYYISSLKMSIVGFKICLTGMDEEQSCVWWEPIKKLHHYMWVFRKPHCSEKNCVICDNWSRLSLTFTYEKQIP